MRRGKYEKITVPTFNIAICLALVLFVLVALSTYMTQNLFARYVTSAMGSDSARVIKFGQLTVTEANLDENNYRNFVFTPGVDLKKEITVSFGGSEASTIVFIALDTPGWTLSNTHSFALTENPNLMTWSVNSAWTCLESEDDPHVYYVVLDPNESINGYHVITGDTISVSPATQADYDALYTADPDIRINVTAYAVQANGFETVQAAWESLQSKEAAP